MKNKMKTYNKEKAIISLTSWKARINMVHKVIANLIGKCPGFHIVLCLSEEEFPNKENDLPQNLLRFVNSNLIELLWVQKNYKSFKKVLFTMEKYPDVPVISADDDCLYTFNYAEKLYQEWKKDKNYIISMSSSFGSGFGILFQYKFFKNFKEYLTKEIIDTNHDDLFYRFLMAKNNVKKYKFFFKRKEIDKKCVFIDEKHGISSSIKEEKDILKFNKIFKLNLNKAYFSHKRQHKI